MQIKDKKINFLGDSITEGIGVSSPEFKYVNVFKRKFGPALVRNYGLHGTRIARQHTPTPNLPQYDLDFCMRAVDMDDDADIVVVFGGVNDFRRGDAPLGTSSDRTPYTFWGACHTLMRLLIEKYPTATIVFMTPMHSALEDREGRPSLCEFVSIIKKTAEYYSIPVLDLYATLGIQPQIDIQREKYVPDGLHPNDLGAERIADRLGAFFEKL